MARRRTPASSDPFGVLGLSPDATPDQIRRARKRLAKRQHPDVGGSVSSMQTINEAAAEALARAGRQDPSDRRPTGGSSAPPRPTDSMGDSAGERRRVRRDHPSFTIEALPAEAYEALLIAGSVLGQVGDDDPPYRLEVLLDEPPDTWCRLDLVPDGGGSTVSLTVAAGRPDIGVVDVRDLFVAELNQLDWGDDGPSPRLPV